ncbi:DNA-directed RNA polymerase subunit delta [Siminovitchia sp. FSL H7-0308]|uniref:Probable DNA-directed RNA polymerase subunit delta n=1 Tax=Siminovitchia thermophila TaxID=1245522 RepID=A0ABS2R5M8_9BACI|nr:DNA-directed RNA polymerase subunit delta [Siminovitchia thermophila]MBM7714469.1 DNA-directed RNA polymerase subunit delta [Siminovitchia thermophila]
MNLQNLTLEEREEMSLIEIAQYLLEEKKEALPFQELVAQIANYLELSDEEMSSRMLQFYTDLNVDGRFLTLGENRWGLKEWYPFDQVDEEIIAPVKPKKKKKAKRAFEEDEELLELEEEDLEYDMDLEDEDVEEDESLEALREEEEAEYEEEELLDDEDYELEEEEEEDVDLEEEEEEE